MWEYSIDKIRNIALLGHSGSGKTSIADVFLFIMGETTRIGKVDQGNSVFDYDEEEIARKISINLALGYGTYKGFRFNVIDTPGYMDFIGEVYSAVKALDAGIIVIDASSGVEIGSEVAFRFLSENKKAKVFFVNKLKKEHTDFYKTLQELRKTFSNKVFPLQLPIGKELNFEGVFDLLENKAYQYKNGTPSVLSAIPSELQALKEEYFEQIIEAAADVDETIMAQFLEGKEVSIPDLKEALKKGIKSGELFPVLLGDANANIGINLILDFALDYLPSPNELQTIEVFDMKTKEPIKFFIDNKKQLSFVFKTLSDPHIGDLNFVRVFSGKIEPGDILLNTSTGREERINQIYLIKGKERVETNRLSAGEIGALVKLKETKTNHTLSSPEEPVIFPPINFPAPSISVAIVPKTRGDEERISNGLRRLSDEDPTFNFYYDHEQKQQIISGLGELHLDVVISRLKRRFDVTIFQQRPKIHYRETITKVASAQGKYKKQSGGRGQYGDVWLRLEPKPRGSGYEFVNEIFGGAIPAKFIPSVEKGVQEAMNQGFLAGYPVVDLKVTCYDGSYHVVDSSDIAFKIAGAISFRNACENAGVVLLEPIMEVEVITPEQFLGDVMGDINARRGKILGIEAEGSLQKLKALVPEAEMYKYSTALRSITQGRGYFTMKFAHYEEVPKEIAAKIIEEAKKEKKREE